MRRQKHLKNANKSQVILCVMLYLVLSYFFLYRQLIYNTLISNWDLQFHINRVVGLSNVWVSPINFISFSSIGTPVNIFYGWLTLYPVYIFYSLSNNMIFSYNLYLYLLTFITFLAAHFSFYSINKNNLQSITFSVTYTFGMYRAVCVFYRGAIGEVIGLAIYPLLFLVVYKILIENKNNWISLSLLFSLLLYSHIISSLIAIIFIVIFYCITMFSKSEHKIEITKTMIKAGFSSFLLSAAFLIPMIEQYIYKKINPPLEVNLKDRSLPIFNLVKGSFSLDLLSYSIGLIPICFIIYLLFYFRKMNITDRCIYIVSIVSLFLVTDLFPWQFLQRTPFNIIQFPWRLLGIATLLSCYLGSKYIFLQLNSALFKNIVLTLLILFSVFTNYTSINNLLNNSDSIFKNSPTLNNEAINNLKTNMFTFDYAPEGYEHYVDQLKNHEVRIDNAPVEYNKNINASGYIFELSANEGQLIYLPIFNYKGLHLTLNDKVIEIYDQTNVLVNVKASSGTNIIKVSYKYTQFAKFSFLVTIFWLVSLLFFKVKKSEIEAS